MPTIEYATYRLKIEAKDLVGNVTSVTSDNFSIVSTPPETRIRAVVPAVPALGSAQIPSPEPCSNPVNMESTADAQQGKAVEPTAPPTGESEKVTKDLLEKAAGQRLRGDYEEAEKTYTEVVRYDKNNVEARNELGGLLLQQGRYQQAIDVLQQARRLAPGDADVLYNLGGAYYALGNYEDAAASFETLAGIDPQNDTALWNLAKSYLAAHDVTRARQTWQKIIDMNRPGSPFVKKAKQALESVPEPKAKK